MSNTNGPDAQGSAPTSSAPTSSATAPATTDDNARAAIQTVLQQNPDMLGALTGPVVHDFYQQRQFTPAWTDAQGLTPRGRQVRGVLETAWVDGLTGLPPLPTPTLAPTPATSTNSTSTNFTSTDSAATSPAPVPPGQATTPSPRAAVTPTQPTAAPAHPPHALDPMEQARLDVMLTVALADYAQRAAATRRAPTAALVVSVALRDIARDDPAANQPGRLFRLFSDEDRQARLRRAVLRYDAMAQAGGWPTPPITGPKLEPGAVHPDIALVRARLRVTGDETAATPANPAFFDAALVEAVHRFQHRQGLSVDGKIGPKTREALATPVDQRLRQMALNLHRLRTMPPASAGRSIEVNIPDAALEGREDGRTTFRSDVIVGRSDRPTPELSSAINTVVLNPTWTVPTTIAHKDILPKIRRDPEYLSRSGFTVYDGWDRDSDVIDPTTIDWSADDINIRTMRLRQAPGDDNALGRIKFLFPNDYDVYLHSTPSRSLFGRAERAFSSGCVRVRDPMDLAEFVLNDGVHTADSVTKEIEGGTTRTVHPRKAVPLSIVYVTAWVDESDTVQFRRDVYGEDARQMDRIARRPASSAPAPMPATAVRMPPPAAAIPASAIPASAIPASAPTRDATRDATPTRSQPTPNRSPSEPDPGFTSATSAPIPSPIPSPTPSSEPGATGQALDGHTEDERPDDGQPAIPRTPVLEPASEDRPTATHDPQVEQAWPPLPAPISDLAPAAPAQTSDTSAGTLY